MPNNDYRSTIYSAMQSAYPGDFTLKEDEFRKNLDENPAYVKTVFSAVKSAYEGEFTLSEQDFYKKIAGQAPSKTPTTGEQPAPAQAPAQKAPRNPNTAYFKYLIEPFKDSDVFQRMLQEYDPKNPDQGTVTQYMSSLKKRSSSVTGIGVQNYKNDEYATIDALTKDFQARKASEAEQIYNGNKEAFDAYKAMSEKAESIASQIKKVAKQRDAIQNTKISVDDQKSLGVIKSQYDNLLAQLKDRDKTFLKLDSEIAKKGDELKHAMDMGIPDVMLSSYNQEVSTYLQRISDEYDPAKKERDALVSKLKELDNSYNAVLSKYPGLSDSRFKSLNGTVQALYSQYNGIVNQIEDFENQYGSDLSKIQENYRLINEAEKFRWQAYSGSGYNQQAQKETDESIKQSGALSNPVANFVVSTLARTATVFLNTTKDLLSAPETLANMSEAGKEIAKSPQVAPVMNLLKAATETLDFIAQDDKPSYDPGDAMSPYTGQSFYKYDKFQKFDDKTGEWSKTGAGYLQEGIAQIAQIYVAGGITKGAMTGIGAETVSAGKAISAIARQGAAASKSEILGFAKTAAVSTGVMGAVSLPGYYREGLSKFGDNDFAKAYATSMAAAEGLLETILPDADLAARFSKNLGVSDLYKIWKSEGKKGLIAIIKDRSSDLVKENIEEIGAQAAGHIFERIGAAFNAEGTDGINSISQWDWDETAETAGIVSISMGILGVPGAYGAYKMNRPGAMPSPGRSRAVFEMAKRYNVEDPNNEVTIGLQSLATTGAVSQQELAEIEKHIHAASVVIKSMNLDQLGVGQRTKEAIAVVLADAEVESQRIEALSSSGVSSEKLKSASEGIRAKAQDKVAEILSDPEFEQKSADQELREAQEAEDRMAQEIESDKREQIRLGANMPLATHAVGATVEYNGRVGIIELSDSSRVLFVDNETGKSEEIPLDDHTTDSAMNAGIRIIEGVANPSVMDSLDLVLMDVPGSTVEGGRRKPYYVQVKSKAGNVADENALVFSQSKKSKNLHEVKDPQMKARIIAEYNKQKVDEGMPSVKASEKTIEERSMESPQTRNTSYVSNAIASENKTPKEADEAREALEAARKSGVLAQDLKDGAVKYSEVSKAYRAVGIPVVPLDIRSEFAEKEDEYDMPQMDSSTEAVSQEEGSATPSGKARRIQVRGRSFPLPDSVSMLASEQETEKKRSYATPGSLLHSNLGMLIKVQRALNKLFGAKSVKYAIFWNQDEFNQFTKEVNPGNTGNSFYDKASNTIFLSSQTLLNEDKFHESIHPIVAAYFATPDGDVKMQKFFQDMINESSSDHVKWQNQTGTTRTAKEYVSSAVKLWMGVRSVDMKRLSQVDPEAYDFLSSSIATYSMAWMEFYKELGSISGKPMSFDALMNEGVTEYATQVVVLASAASNSNNSAKRLFSLADMIMSKVGLSKKRNTIPTSPSGITDIIAAESLHAFASGIGSAFANAEVIEGRKLELRLPDSSDEDLLYSMRPVIQAHFERDVQMKIMRGIEEGGLYNKMSASDIAKHILPQNIYKEIAWVFDLSDKLGVKISVDSKSLSQNFARGMYRSSVGVITIGEQSFNSKYNMLPPYLSFVGTVFHEFVHALLDPSNGVVSDFHIDEIRSKCTELHGIISKKVDEILADDNSSIMDIESAFVWNGLFKDTYSPKNADWNDTFEELVTYGLSDVYIGHLMKISSPTNEDNRSGAGSFIFGKLKEEYDDARAPQENHLEDSVLDEVSRMLDKAAYETVSFTRVLETRQAEDGRILFSKRFDMSSLSSEELKKAVKGTPWAVRENLLKSIKDHSYVYRTIYGEFDTNWPGRQYFSLDLAYTLGYGNRTYRFLIPNKDVLNLHDYNVLFRSSPKSSMYSLPGKDLFEIHSDNYQQSQPLWIQLATYGRAVGKEAEQELKEKINKYKAHRAKDSGSEHDAISIENSSLLVDPIDWLSEFLKSPDLNKVYDQDLAKKFLISAAESYYGGVDFSMRAPKFRELGTAERISRQFVGQNVALSVLRSDPSRLYTPQRWDEIKDDLDMMSEAQIINYIDNGDASSIENYIASIGNTGTSANMWVMANIELMNRYEASGNEAMAAAVYSRLMQSATYFAQALAQYAKLNSSSAAHLTRRIVAHIKSFGRTVTKAQVSLLESDVKRMMMANKAVSDYLLNQKEELDTNGISTFSVDAHNALEKSRMEANKRLDEKLSKLMPESLWEALGTNMRGNLLTLGSSTIGLFSNITNAAFLATGGMSRATDYALNKTGVSRGMSTRTVNPISFTNILLKTMSRFFSKENLNRYAEIMKSGEVFDGQANEKYDVSRSLRPLLAMRHGIKMLQDIANNDFSKFDASFKTSTKEYDAVTWSIDMAANTISVSLSKSGKNVGSFTMDTVSYEDFIDNPVVIDQINASVHSGVHAGTIMESGKAYVPRASKTEAVIKLGASGLLAAVPAVMLRAIQMSDTPIREVTTFGRLYEYGYVLGLRGADLELFARAPHLWGQQMADRVVQEASAVTFQEHTMLGDLVRKVTGGKTMLNNIGKDSSGNLMLRGMRRFFVGMIQPFISFPANFLSQSLEYVVWQYTLAKSVYHMHEVKMSATVQERDINRQKAVRAFSKAMVGMALEKAALYLIYAGIITLPPDDDDKKQSATAKTVGDRKFNVDGLRRWMNAGGFSNPENTDGAYQEGDDLWSIESLGILGTFIQLAASDAANNIQENTDSVVLGTEGGVDKLKKVKSGSLISEPENEGFADKTLGFFMNTMDHAIVLTSSVFEFGFMQGTANLMASIPKMSKGNRSEEVNRLVSGMAKAASAAVLPGVGLAGQVNRFMVEQERVRLSQEDDDDFGFNVFTQKRPGENRPIENTIGYSVRQSLASYGFGKISPEMFISEGVFPAVDMFGQPVNYSGKPKNLAAYMLNPTRAEDGDYSEQELFLYSLQKSIAPGRDMKSAMAIPTLPMEKMTIDVSLPDGTSVPVAVGAKEWADFNKIAGAYVRKEIYSILDKYDYKSMNPFVVDSKRAKLVTELTEKYKEMGTGDQLAQYSGDPAIISAYERLIKSAIRRMSEDEEVGSVPVKDESTGKSMPMDKAVKESIQE